MVASAIAPGCAWIRASRIDIRDRQAILQLVESTRPTVIVHTAAQPSNAAADYRQYIIKAGEMSYPLARGDEKNLNAHIGHKVFLRLLMHSGPMVGVLASKRRRYHVTQLGNYWYAA